MSQEQKYAYIQVIKKVKKLVNTPVTGDDVLLKQEIHNAFKDFGGVPTVYGPIFAREGTPNVIQTLIPDIHNNRQQFEEDMLKLIQKIKNTPKIFSRITHMAWALDTSAKAIIHALDYVLWIPLLAFDIAIGIPALVLDFIILCILALFGARWYCYFTLLITSPISEFIHSWTPQIKTQFERNGYNTDFYPLTTSIGREMFIRDELCLFIDTQNALPVSEENRERYVIK
jgi:hypothetical protein